MTSHTTSCLRRDQAIARARAWVLIGRSGLVVVFVQADLTPTRAFNALWERAETTEQPLRDAALDIAVSRVSEALTVRGLYP